MGEESKSGQQWTRYTTVFLILLIVYPLSAGPVVGLGFWLVEKTGNQNFYAAIFYVYPMFLLIKGTPLFPPYQAYLEFWVVDVFDTVGPG